MSVSKRLRYEILRRDNHTCRYCHATDTPLTIDHVVPVALGGTDDPSNLVAACKDCNAGKASSSPDAATVADVSEDALRWARAIRAAIDLEEAAQGAIDQWCANFQRMWDGWVDGHERPIRVPLPPSWRDRITELSKRPDVLGRDIEDAVEIAIKSRYDVREPFYYFLGIVNNKAAKRQEAARQLIADGAV